MDVETVFIIFIHNAKSQNMRFLMHLIGDIHQPLHVLNFFSKDFPNGDDSMNNSRHLIL